MVKEAELQHKSPEESTSPDCSDSFRLRFRFTNCLAPFHSISLQIKIQSHSSIRISFRFINIVVLVHILSSIGRCFVAGLCPRSDQPQCGNIKEAHLREAPFFFYGLGMPRYRAHQFLMIIYDMYLYITICLFVFVVSYIYIYLTCCRRCFGNWCQALSAHM